MNKRVGVLGATSLVGAELLPLLIKNGWQIRAYTRQSRERVDAGIEWRQIDDVIIPEQSSYYGLPVEDDIRMTEPETTYWVCLVPIWVLPNYLNLLAALGARRVVVLSSTSRFTKDRSSDRLEQAIAQRLVDGEERFIDWAKKRGVEWIILRPTLVYGMGCDKNIAEIALFIHRFKFFPLFEQAKGLRQPVHAADVAAACISALESKSKNSRAYNLSGGETLSYREMVGRVFSALGRRPTFIPIPLPIFWLAANCLRVLPRYRHWSVAMAERMNQDLVFDHQEATNDLDFRPRPFQLDAEDMPEVVRNTL